MSNKHYAKRARELSIQLASNGPLDPATRSELTALLVTLANLVDRPSARKIEHKAPRRQSRSSDDLIALDAVKHVASQHPSGDLLPVRDVRRIVPRMPKDKFDRAMLALAEAGNVVLHHTDFPGRYRPEELAELVDDGRGTYYVGVALRE